MCLLTSRCLPPATQEETGQTTTDAEPSMQISLAGQVCNIVFNQLRVKTPEFKFCDLAAEALSELSNVAKPHPVGAAYRALCHAQAALAEEIQSRLDGAEPRDIDQVLFQQKLDARLVRDLRVSFGYLAPGGQAIQWEEDVRKDECGPLVIRLRLEKFGGRYTLQVADTVSFTGSLVTNLSGLHVELEPATQVPSPMPDRTSPPLQAAAPGTGTTTGNESASKKNRKAAAATQGGVPMTAEQSVALPPRLASSPGWYSGDNRLIIPKSSYRRNAKIANILSGLDGPSPPVHTREAVSEPAMSSPSTPPGPSTGHPTATPVSNPTAAAPVPIQAPTLPDPLSGLKLLESGDQDLLDLGTEETGPHLYEDDSDEDEPSAPAPNAGAPAAAPALSTQTMAAAAPGVPPTLGSADSQMLLCIEAILKQQIQSAIQQIQSSTQQIQQQTQQQIQQQIQQTQQQIQILSQKHQALEQRLAIFEKRISRQMAFFLEVACVPLLLEHLKETLGGTCSCPVQGRVFCLSDERAALLARAQALRQTDQSPEAGGAAAQMELRARAPVQRTPQLEALVRKFGGARFNACEIDLVSYYHSQPGHHPTPPTVPASEGPSEGYCVAECTLLSLKRKLRRLRGESILTFQITRLERAASILRLRFYLKTGHELTWPIRYAALIVRAQELSYARAQLDDVFATHPGAFPHMEALLRHKCLVFLPVRVYD
ncbi:hypothetical protein PAPYR_10509 [Paratrimastix pyriformis]|uniref:Mediator complex subunit 14 n=1 Tax=Paratrimastix pyriformis TaxID=342808 RepID=A0ABQ8UAS3_9EUKA|nr:hypothetical protein PAPYR_10509 [Paratrimastix pyriformis]